MTSFSALIPWWLDLLAGLALHFLGLALSFYIAISLFWLGLMVLLVGNRRSLGSWLVAAGMLLGALFFTSHTAILGKGIGQTGLGMNFWWWVSWAPAATAPFAWYAAMLWHSGFRFTAPHPHRLWTAITAGLGAGVLLLLGFANPVPTYGHVAGRLLSATPAVFGVPVLILLYVLYALLCFLLPLHLFTLPTPPANPWLNDARRRARPWLAGASLAMGCAAVLLAITAIWALSPQAAGGLAAPAVIQTVLLFDLAVLLCVAAAVTLLGKTVVAFELFTGQPFPRGRLTTQWRMLVLFAGGFSLLAAALSTLQIRPLYAFMAAAALSTLVFSLLFWRANAERGAMLSRLRPFLRGQNLLGSVSGRAEEADDSAGELFANLVSDTLGASRAALLPGGRFAALSGSPLRQPPDLDPAPFRALAARHAALQRPELLADDLGWILPLRLDGSPAGWLFLGPKVNGRPYQQEEMELAQMGGERLLDRQAATAVARLSLELTRHRLGDARQIEGASRRLLHDQVLPELHTALLALHGSGGEAEASAILQQAHQRVAGLLQSGYGIPDRLNRLGLAAALGELATLDFGQSFGTIRFECAPAEAAAAQRLDPLTAETVYYAVRELLRNAARHAAGDGSARDIHIALTIESAEDGFLTIEVADDGVGRGNSSAAGDVALNSTGGAGEGLRLHSAMVTAAGGSLEERPGAERGTVSSLRIPRP